MKLYTNVKDNLKAIKKNIVERKGRIFNSPDIFMIFKCLHTGLGYLKQVSNIIRLVVTRISGL